MSDSSIKERLRKYYNCKIIQVPLGEKHVKVENRIKIGLRKILGIIPVYEYKLENNVVEFDDSVELTSTNVYTGRLVDSATVSIAYDRSNKVLYWKRVS